MGLGGQQGALRASGSRADATGPLPQQGALSASPAPQEGDK